MVFSDGECVDVFPRRRALIGWLRLVPSFVAGPPTLRRLKGAYATMLILFPEADTQTEDTTNGLDHADQLCVYDLRLLSLRCDAQMFLLQ